MTNLADAASRVSNVMVYVYVNSRRCVSMTDECKIRLLISKSLAYKTGYQKAVEKGDAAAAGKWKDGYRTIIEEIDALRQKLA
jgi:hypothetical protein